MGRLEVAAEVVAGALGEFEAFVGGGEVEGAFTGGLTPPARLGGGD